MALNSSRLAPSDPESALWDAINRLRAEVSALARNGGGAGGSVDLSPFVRKDLAVAKGDIFVATGASTIERLPVGLDEQVLTADSSTTLGVRWGSGGVGFPNYDVRNASTDTSLNMTAGESLNAIANFLGAMIADYATAPMLTYSSTYTPLRNFNAASFTLNDLGNAAATLADDLSTGNVADWTVSGAVLDRGPFDVTNTTENQVANVLGSFVSDVITFTGDLT